MTKTLHRAVPALALAAALLSAAAARADEAGGVALFEEAKQLLKVGDYAGACPKIAEAQRLFPTAAKLLSLGNCYEQIGRLASAWGAFKEAEIMARGKGDAEREQEGARRAGLLAPRLAKLAIVVPPAARLPGLELRRDGEPVGEPQYGSALPVDVGRHMIEAKAPGFKAWSQALRVDNDGSSASVDVPVLEAAAAAPVAGSSAPPFWSAQRIAGVAVGSAGVVGLVVGGVFGGIAISKNNQSKQECSPTDPNFCNNAGVALREDTKTASSVSTAAIVVGGVALAGGIVLIVAAPSGKKPDAAARVEIVPWVGGGALRGRF